MGVAEIESNCTALAGIFQGLINDMRDGVPAFEELVNRSTKLHSSLRNSITAVGAFLEAFQRVADVATNSKGATKEIGKSLTRLCLRHRSIESKLKVFTNAMMDELVGPLQDKLEDWKKNTVQIDKEHAKDAKKARVDIKRASSDTVRLQKKARKGKTTYSKGDAKERLESAMVGVTDKFLVLEDCEKSYVRKAFIEERRHYCDLICCMRPVVDSEMAMVHEMSHLQEIIDHLSSLAADPDSLPELSEQVIRDIKGTSVPPYKSKTPPDSPTSDRHSLSSSVTSLVSAHGSDNMSQRSASPSRLQPLKSQTTGLLSVASQDSGFTSQDALYARQPSSYIQHDSNSNQVARNHGSVEEERSDSVSVYSSVSQGSHDFDSASLHSGSAHSAGLPTALQSQLKAQLDRAHTIGGGRPVNRPSISCDMYEPPSQNSRSNRSSASEYSGSTGPPRPQRMSSVDSARSNRSSLSASENNRVSLPPKNRTKPKPVALPSVPFMDTEPIYMNTHELAKKIAEKNQQERSGQQPVNSNAPHKAPTTEREEREANNDALADALKELEATTAALNCFDDTYSRQSVVSSSGYGTTTSNSSASEEVPVVTQDTTDRPHHIALIPTTSIKTQPNDCSQPPNNINYQQQQQRPPGNVEANWTGTVVLRRQNASSKPPPPVRRSSSIASSMGSTGAADRNSGRERGSKPPVISPKPKVPAKAVRHSNSSGGGSRVTSTISVTSNSSDSFPAPPPEHNATNDDSDPYAVPMNCQPIEALPPPPGFELPPPVDGMLPSLPFNISELPPPLPDTPPPPRSAEFSVHNHQPPVHIYQPLVHNHQPPVHNHQPPVANVSEQTTTQIHTTANSNTRPPWDNTTRTDSTSKMNSRGTAPPPTLAKKGKKLNTNFMAQLDAKLGGQSQSEAPPPSSRSNPAALSSIMNSRSRDSPPRDNLLSQIQGGVRLRRAEQVNDRSAPKI